MSADQVPRTSEPPNQQRATWWYLVVSVTLIVLGVAVSIALLIPAVSVGPETAVGFFLTATLGSAGYAIVAVVFV